MTERDVFIAALQMENLAQRQAYLAKVCADHPALRKQVEDLLRLYDGAGSFLQKPMADAEDTGAFHHVVMQGAPAEAPGTLIGPYKLMEQIGEGGMGLVFVAEQQEPIRRKVALKVLKPGMDTRQVVARFEAERQALALMDHPNIAQVHDGGETSSGRPYFVMELVKGVPITQFCDDNRLTPRERLQLFVDVCQAVQHAHQKGVIHRDIKPSNVLVTSHDGTPVVKVIDFGIAKAVGQQLTDKTVYTQFAQLIGTPLYMSPEQAGQSGLDIDTRSDIYSLGVLLYELLTGTTPFNQERLKQVGYDEMRRIIREEEPPKPSTRISTLGQAATTVSTQRQSDPKRLSRLFRGELDWIVMRALEKDRNRRYETASAFAADVQRYLHDEPVLACPPSAMYRFRKFARRHKTALAVAVVLGLALLLAVGSITGSIGWMARERAGRRAEAAERTKAALDVGTEFLEQEKYAECRLAAQRAMEAFGETDGDPELGERLRQLTADLKFVDQSETIRLSMTAVRRQHFDSDRADPDYREAFQQYGVDVEALDTYEAVRRIQGSAIKKQLVAALDNWVAIKYDKALPGWERLRIVADRADPDPWRERLKQAAEKFRRKGDRKPLEVLARDEHVSTLPPESVLLLADALADEVDVRMAVEVLQRAQPRHADDFWINHTLGYRLAQAGRPAEAVGFFRVSLSLRPDNPGVRTDLANALAIQGQWAEAVTEYREAIRRHPEYAQAHYNLGCVLQDQGEPVAAALEYRAAIRQRPDSADARINLSGILRDQGKFDEALKELQNAEGHCRWPNSPEARYHRGAVLLKQHRYADAETDAREALRLLRHGQLVEARQANLIADTFAAQAAAPTGGGPLGYCLREVGALAVAEPDTLPLAIESVPDFREARRPNTMLAISHVLLGDILLAQKKYQEAEPIFRKAMRLKSNHAEAHRGLADALDGRGDKTTAAAEYRAALGLQPKNVMAHNNLGVLLLGQGRSAEAVDEFRKTVDLQPAWAEAHINLASALLKQTKLTAAEAEFRTALRLAPKDHGAILAKAHGGLGHCLAKQGKRRAAEVELRQAIELDDKLAASHCILGLLLIDQHKLAAAERECQRAVDLEPEMWEAHANLGLALQVQGKLAKAADEYRQALKIKPDSPETLNNLGRLLCTQGKFAEAETECRKALKVNPELAMAHYQLGNASLGLQRLTAAEKAYREAIRLQSDLLEAHCDLGVLLFRQHKIDEAIAEYRIAIRINPKHHLSHSNLSNALFVQRKYTDADAEAREAIRLKSDYALAHYNLAEALHKLGKLDESAKEYGETVRLAPQDALAHFRRGEVLREQGKLAEAADAFRQAVRLEPGDAEDRYELGRTLLAMKKPAEAEAAFRQAIRLQPDYAEAHCELGLTLLHLGKFTAARVELRRGHELGSKRQDWRFPSKEWMRDCERMVALDDKLSLILQGKDTPADTAERIELARLCQQDYRSLYAAAYRFYTKAFADDPKLLDDRQAFHRSNAARAAVRAAAGQGKDAANLKDAERGRLRGQALSWLRADLAAWGQELDKELDKVRPLASKQLQHWQNDADFATVRGAEALARLPEAERKQWQQLWDDVVALLTKAGDQK
jgi:tetratricopeptide (TPR) repeat protein/serine/threonine protein kinase